MNEIKKQHYVYVYEYKDSFGEDKNQVSMDKKKGATRKSLDNLSTEEMAQVLRIAQSKATKESKQKVFNQK